VNGVGVGVGVGVELAVGAAEVGAEAAKSDTACWLQPTNAKVGTKIKADMILLIISIF
jgi:hypothetical protein